MHAFTYENVGRREVGLGLLGISPISIWPLWSLLTLSEAVSRPNIFFSLLTKQQVGWYKTFTENWDSKAPSVETLLAYVETTA